MKKRILAMLISALLVANFGACNQAPDNELDETLEKPTPIDTMPSDTTPTTPTVKDLEGTEPETPPTTWEGTIACNGVYRNSKVQYAIDQNKQLILYIENWDESFCVPNEDMYFVAETVYSSSVVLGEAQGALIFGDFSFPAKPIKVIKFAKGNPQVTVENLIFPVNEPYAFKICNFIDKQTGYLFLFNTEGHETQLSKLIKTTDGGQTWVEQTLNDIPTTYWKEEIICAKMINENIGFIAGSHYSDENFSRRTYVTADGGLTWSGVDIQYPQNSFELGLGCEEACDMLYEDGTYILICRFRSYREDSSYSYIWVKYTSTDLITWAEVR